MPRAYSMDLRERMAASVDAGMSRNATAKQFSVAVSTVIKLRQARQATGSLAPKRMGGYRKAILAPHEETVKALVQATPDATLAELGKALGKKKIKVSRSALAAFLQRTRLTFKKNPACIRAGPR